MRALRVGYAVRVLSVLQGGRAVLPFEFLDKMRYGCVSECVGYFLHGYFAVFEVGERFLEAQCASVFARRYAHIFLELLSELHLADAA